MFDYGASAHYEPKIMALWVPINERVYKDPTTSLMSENLTVYIKIQKNVSVLQSRGIEEFRTCLVGWIKSGNNFFFFLLKSQERIKIVLCHV